MAGVKLGRARARGSSFQFFMCCVVKPSGLKNLSVQSSHHPLSHPPLAKMSGVAGAIAKALKPVKGLWSVDALLWTSAVVAYLFLVASSIAAAASSPIQLSSAAADELVSLKLGTKTTQTDTNNVSTVTFTPVLGGGAAGMVLVSVLALLLVALAGLGMYATRAASKAV